MKTFGKGTFKWSVLLLLLLGGFALNTFAQENKSQMTIEADPEIVRPYYQDLADLYKPGVEDICTTDIVIDIYGKEGTHIYTVDNWFEYFSYVTIWEFPLLLIMPYVIELYANAKKATPVNATIPI